MAVNPLLIGPISELFNKVIDRIWPDKVTQATERDKAQLALLQAQQSGDLQAAAQQMEAILAEASSSDPLTSRARPTFLYVMYIMLLMGIPMGFVSAISPEVARNIAEGFRMWLEAIPEPLYVLFGTGYLGYTVIRSWDKRSGVSK